jgi:hypothetical protein
MGKPELEIGSGGKGPSGPGLLRWLAYNCTELCIQVQFFLVMTKAPGGIPRPSRSIPRFRTGARL